VSQIIRVGPQDAKRPVSLDPGDTLEVALPEGNVSGTWKVDFDRGLLWDEEEDERQARWVLGEGLQQTLRTFLALTAGSCILHCEFRDLQNGNGRVLEAVDFTLYIGLSPSQQKKLRPPERSRSAPPPAAPRRHEANEPTAAFFDSRGKIQQLENENRRLQERLWDLTHKVVQIAEDYAAIVKGKIPRHRP